MEKAGQDDTKIINIGEMKHRIRLYNQVNTGRNPNTGRPITQQVLVDEVWAYISNLHGTEYYTAAMVKVQKEVSMTFRYLDGVKESTEIWFNGHWYDIQFIDDVKYRHRFLQCKVAIETSTIPPDDLKNST
ncbi:head-tail adaptor protein [Limosilactobacillus fermentum]|uniref:phage head closure protein n=1 Tax=Limosilactobacillus fermentum TaxID=1613 RepID=UPI000DBFC40B|nr:phage head closure protein [Limosilactobacillus fermentum]RAM09526.1 head-tail adaptor protein [Limosilactobacillus fermentum]